MAGNPHDSLSKARQIVQDADYTKILDRLTVFRSSESGLLPVNSPHMISLKPAPHALLEIRHRNICQNSDLFRGVAEILNFADSDIMEPFIQVADRQDRKLIARRRCKGKK